MTPPLLEARDLCYRYPGYSEPALDGASFRLSAGRRIALMGRNGSGKSTLFLHCNGILQPMRGEVRLHGTPMGYSRHVLKQWRQQVGLIFQNPDDQLFSASVAQDISFGPLNLGLNEREARERVAAAADMCAITDLLERPTHALSGGQKARVALAGVLAMEPTLILADEVTASLDPWMRRHVLAIFQRFVAQGKTVLLATHDAAFVRSWADEVLVMHAGRMVAADTPDTIFAREDMRDYLGLESIGSG